MPQAQPDLRIDLVRHRSNGAIAEKHFQSRRVRAAEATVEGRDQVVLVDVRRIDYGGQ